MKPFVLLKSAVFVTVVSVYISCETSDIYQPTSSPSIIEQTASPQLIDISSKDVAPKTSISDCPRGQIRIKEPSLEWADLVAKVRTLVGQGNFSDARTEILSSLDLSPQNQNLLYLLSVLEMYDENYESVVDLADSVLSHDDNALPFLETRAIASFLMSDLDQAQRDLFTLLDRLEVVAREKGEYFCNPLSECCETIDAKMGSVNSALATVYYNFGDLDEAERLANSVLRVFPDLPDAWFVMGLIRNKRDDLKGSFEAYQKVLKVQPFNPSAMNNIGVLFYRVKDLNTAEKIFRSAINAYGLDKGGISLTMSNIAEIQMLKGKFRESEELYMSAIRLSKREPAPRYGIAVLYDLLGREKESKGFLMEALTLDPRGISRYNSEYIEPEWRWHMEALLAEIEGKYEIATQYWCKIVGGNVDVLRNTAWRHLSNSTAVCSYRNLPSLPERAIRGKYDFSNKLPLLPPLNSYIDKRN